MLAYYGHDISPNQTETFEGYLICRNVPIARTGTQQYLAGELQLEGDPDRVVDVERRAEDVFEDAALASFEGKPVTDGHPPENVGPENFSAYARGHVQNVRREGEYVVADLYINDPVLASQVQNRVKREVSCGYLCSYTPDGAGYRQTCIRGNHVAVVPRGRAGREVAIKDAAAKAEKGRNHMSDFWKSVLTAFGMAAKDASPEELDAMVTTTASALDAGSGVPNASGAPAVPASSHEDSKKETPEAAPAPEKPVGDKKEEPAKTSDAMSEKLDQVLQALDSLTQAIQKKEETPPLSDETTLDSAIARLSGGDAAGGSVTVSDVPSKDGTVELLKRLRPAVAGITDKAERAQVVDAVLGSLGGVDVMGQIANAAASSARRAADAAVKPDYQKICEEQQAAYDARNPHKKKED